MSTESTSESGADDFRFDLAARFSAKSAHEIRGQEEAYVWDLYELGS
jgi:hypothetical protein